MDHCQLYTFVNKVKVGEGAFGVVYKATNKETGENVALKKIYMKEESDGVPSTALREISLLRNLQHPNIVCLKDAIYYNRNIYLVFECLDMDLRRLMDCYKSGLPPTNCKSYFKQLLSAVSYCHENQILHRDLKPQNLLVNSGKAIIKLADFGLARCFSSPLRPFTHEIITLWYRAPEVLLGTNVYSTSVDIWSLACIFVEMKTGKVLFPGDSEIDQLFRVFRILGTPNEETWPGVSELEDYKITFPHWHPQELSLYLPTLDINELNIILKMLVCYPDDRISAREALKHFYFKF